MTLIKMLLHSTILVALLHLIIGHSVRQIEDKEQSMVSTYVGQAKSIAIPFKKCFKAEPELDANLNYINFLPTRVGLSTLKSYQLRVQGLNMNVLEQLRSPISYKHRNLLVFQGYLLAFFAPNLIQVIEQTRDGFRIKNKYHLQNLERHDQFRMYKLQNKALLVIYNKNQLYLLNEVDYQDYSLPDLSSIIHLQQTGEGMEFFAAESMRGLTHYKLDTKTKTAQIIKRYTGNSIGLEGKFNYIVDLNLRSYSQKIIYVLDAQIGVIEIDLKTQKGKLLLNHRSCQSFDTINQQHFVLLCQNQGHSTVVQAYRYLDRKSNEYKYRKIQPLFQVNYLNDLHLTEKFYLVYSYRAIHIFWNTEKNRLPQSLETQSQIAIPGLETFAMHSQGGQNFLYTIEAGKLMKYELRQEEPIITLKSDYAMAKMFKLYIYGSCNDLNQENPQEGSKIQACKVSKNIVFKVSEQDYPRQKDYSISAVIIIILITVFLLVIWICLKKYKGLEREARKVLQNYQKRRGNKAQRI